MRIATWNVNSLKARLEKLLWWLERAAPDILLMQETKLADGDVPRAELARAGYEIVHHGSGGANGVAIASRVALTDVITNFGLPLDPPPAGEAPKIGASGQTAGTRTICCLSRVLVRRSWLHGEDRDRGRRTKARARRRRSPIRRIASCGRGRGAR